MAVRAHNTYKLKNKARKSAAVQEVLNADVARASALSERQAKVLAVIVKEYSNSGEPVGSDEVSQKYKLNVSSATIRNDMAALEKMGYIEQPHTSAGRVPTDLGYRYFVNELMKRFELSIKEQRELRIHLRTLQQQHQELGRKISRLLAEKTDQAAFALFPEESSAAGLTNILQQANLTDKSDIMEVVNFFENIDEYAQKMLTTFFADKPETLIGKEHHLANISNYSLIVSKVALPEGKSGLIGIIGPKAMRYDKNITLVDYVAKVLSGSATGLVLLLFIQAKI